MKKVIPYEITLKVYLLEDIPREKALIEIASLIDRSLLSQEETMSLHKKNKFKGYCFNNMFPLKKAYGAGSIYSVQIRTINPEFLEHAQLTLQNAMTNKIKALVSSSKKVGPKDRLIDSIYSITPVLIKTANGYWRGSVDVTEYLQRIRINLIKKYNYFYDTKIDENFELFRSVEFLNRKPVGCKYKNIVLLGDKLKLQIAENEIAQELAKLAIGTGIGEMNARGYGFVNYKSF